MLDIFKFAKAIVFTIKSFECRVLNPEFLNVSLCGLYGNGRKSSVSTTLHLLQPPITSANITIQIGFHDSNSPYLVNATWDLCTIMQNRQRNRSLNRLFNYVGPYTNFNHSCPYHHDILVRNVSLTKPLVPIPNSAYKVSVEILMNKKYRVKFNARVDLVN
ncbi:uncharacterized protein [Musca autumnalis]|uniref:uncharacterized protein n=1 Tax=Musca autumnalis TaxID=221902 RepID=UPI003CF663AD